VALFYGPRCKYTFHRGLECIMRA